MDAVPARKAALFVDFDNIYLSLQKADRRAAERFARQPDRWLRWLAAGAHAVQSRGEAGGQADPRAVLLRRCYLTPNRFGDYRPYFTRAGFMVVDCPPLTGMGKNSADIVMVMDILDALEHQTRFEEFLVFSGDADFTPVLLRLRMHDRRTAVLTDAFTAAAYRAASDIAILQDAFVEEALGVDDVEPARTARGGPLVTPLMGGTIDLAAIADGVAVQLLEKGRLTNPELLAVFRQWPAFTSGPRWFGQGTLRRLCERLREIRPEIGLEPGDEVALHLSAPPAAPAVSEAPPAAAASPSVEPSPVEIAATGALPLRDQILGEVRNALAASPRPIEMASLGLRIIQTVGQIAKESDWAGAGTLGNLIRRASLPDMMVYIGGGIGFAYDPNRHLLDDLPTGTGEATPPDLPPELVEVIDKVTSVTDCPKLAPADYRLLFELIAGFDFGADVNMNRASAAMRDACAAKNRPVGRRAINFVLAGLRYHDFDFGHGNRTPEGVAAAFRDNLIDLCNHASLPLSETEKVAIGQWLGLAGGVRRERVAEARSDVGGKSAEALPHRETSTESSPGAANASRDIATVQGAAGNGGGGAPTAEGDGPGRESLREVTGRFGQRAVQPEPTTDQPPAEAIGESFRGGWWRRR